jgi:hypothetical protein
MATVAGVDQVVSDRAGRRAQPAKRRAPGVADRPSASTLVGVSTIVHLPDELAARLAAEAARRAITTDELLAELVATRLPAAEGDDPLEAFIGSGRSGRGDLARRHREIKNEIIEGLAAGDL